MRRLYAFLHLTLFLPLLLGAEEPKPNILFIVSDDLATRVGCYGDKAAITPNIDRLAAEGMCFDRAFVQGVVCTPSRTAFMLGLNNRNARRNHFVMHPETMTMGRWFRQHGYQTFSVGKIDHGKPFIDPKAWEIRGEFEEKGWPAPLATIWEDGEKAGPQQRRVSRYGVAASAEGTRDWKVTERTLQFFRDERDTERPFFAAVGFFKPHQPCITTEAHFQRHTPERFTLQPTPRDATPVGHVAYVPGIELSEKNQRLAQRAYYAATSHMDEQLGRLLDFLRDTGDLENTLLIFTSDHGYHLGWRGQWAKGDLSEEVMRVPLIARFPGVVPPGTRTEGIVELIDLFPTFAEVAGIPVPTSLDGKSFLPQLKDPDAPGKTAAFCDNGASGRTVRTANWRLTQYPNGKDELYHLPSDPGEYHNVVGDPGNAAVVERHANLLAAELGDRPAPIGRRKRPARKGTKQRQPEGQQSGQRAPNQRQNAISEGSTTVLLRAY